MFRMLSQGSNLDKVAECYPQSGEPGWEPDFSQVMAGIGFASQLGLLRDTISHKERC